MCDALGNCSPLLFAFKKPVQLMIIVSELHVYPITILFPYNLELSLTCVVFHWSHWTVAMDEFNGYDADALEEPI